jgi:hypothetical protein
MPEQNFYDLIPERNRNFEKLENGLIAVMQPKFQNRLLVKYLVPRLKKPFIVIHLDEIGSHLWQNCDGQKTIRQLAESLQQDFGEKVDPVFDRVILFFQKLYNLQLIKYLNYQGK